MARRHPLTVKGWLLGLAGTIVTALALYYGRVAVIEHMMARQIERTEARMAHIQQQQSERLAARQASQAQQQQPTQSTYDDQVAKAFNESKKRHDAAWDSYYVPPKGCDIWRGDTHMVECVNHKMRARKEFEQKWAAGELDQPKG